MLNNWYINNVFVKPSKLTFGLRQKLYNVTTSFGQIRRLILLFITGYAPISIWLYMLSSVCRRIRHHNQRSVHTLICARVSIWQIRQPQTFLTVLWSTISSMCLFQTDPGLISKVEFLAYIPLFMTMTRKRSPPAKSWSKAPF